MKPNLCLATFRTPFDDREHHCFATAGHMDTRPHRCICLDLGMPSRYSSQHYDRKGKPITFCAWALLFEDREGYGRVRATTVGQWWISTIWLGLDHGFNYPERADYQPVIFETMVFWHGPEGMERMYEEGDRYSTEAEARRGHASFIRRIRQRVRAMPKFPVDGLDPIKREC